MTMIQTAGSEGVYVPVFYCVAAVLGGQAQLMRPFASHVCGR